MLQCDKRGYSVQQPFNLYLKYILLLRHYTYIFNPAIFSTLLTILARLMLVKTNEYIMMYLYLQQAELNLLLY